LKKALTIGLVAAALAATLPFVFAGSKGAVPSADTRPEYRLAASVRLADASAVVPAYTRGPLIIHVPQATERNDDDDLAPPPRRQIAPPVRATPRWTPHRDEAPPPRRSEPTPQPRAEPRAVRHIDMSKPKAEAKAEPSAPQPPSPRRAVLSAPSRIPEMAADTPPPDYTPSAASPRDDGHANSY
jgi:hypothetical protein